jgi:hypothetical protein
MARYDLKDFVRSWLEPDKQKRLFELEMRVV